MSFGPKSEWKNFYHHQVNLLFLGGSILSSNIYDVCFLLCPNLCALCSFVLLSTTW